MQLSFFYRQDKLTVQAAFDLVEKALIEPLPMVLKPHPAKLSLCRAMVEERKRFTASPQIWHFGNAKNSLSEFFVNQVYRFAIEKSFA